MAKWEYCQLLWMIRVISDEQKEDLEKSGFGGVFRPETDSQLVAELGYITFFGAEKRETITDLGGTMARLGLDGWELVSHTEASYPTQLDRFFFKREIVPEQEL